MIQKRSGTLRTAHGMLFVGVGLLLDPARWPNTNAYDNGDLDDETIQHRSILLHTSSMSLCEREDLDLERHCLHIVSLRGIVLSLLTRNRP